VRRRIWPVKISAFLAVATFAVASAVRTNRAEAPSPPTPLRIIFYDLSYALDYDRGLVSGEARLTIQNPTTTPGAKIPFVLYRLFKVDKILDAAGKPLAYVQRVLPFEDWKEFQANFLEVDLPIPAQGRTELTIFFGGPLLGNTESGMQYVKDRVDKAFTILRSDCLAYPEIGWPSWKERRSLGMPQFDYRLRVDVPTGLFVANGGDFVEKTESAGRTTFVYRNIKPAWRIDAAIAPYKTVEDGATKSRIFFLPGDEAGARNVAVALRETLALLSRWFGPASAFRGFSIIEVPEGFGSQADVTSILQTRDAFVDAAKLPQLYHEISHLWSVPARDPLPARLESEGLAMFLQYAVQESREGKAGALKEGAERCRKRFAEACGKNAKAAGTPIIDFGKSGLTDLSYNKGMLYFYMLDKLAGRDRFLSAWADFYRRYGQKGATTAEFLGRMDETLGIDLARLNADWIFGTKASDLLLSSASFDEIAASYR